MLHTIPSPLDRIACTVGVTNTQPAGCTALSSFLFQLHKVAWLRFKEFIDLKYFFPKCHNGYPCSTLTMIGLLLNDEMEGVWQEATVA
jgi:hypothetical protein